MHNLQILNEEYITIITKSKYSVLEIANVELPHRASFIIFDNISSIKKYVIYKIKINFQVSFPWQILSEIYETR